MNTYLILFFLISLACSSNKDKGGEKTVKKNEITNKNGGDDGSQVDESLVSVNSSLVVSEQEADTKSESENAEVEAMQNSSFNNTQDQREKKEEQGNETDETQKFAIALENIWDKNNKNTIKSYIEQGEDLTTPISLKPWKPSAITILIDHVSTQNRDQELLELALFKLPDDALDKRCCGHYSFYQFTPASYVAQQAIKKDQNLMLDPEWWWERLGDLIKRGASVLIDQKKNFVNTEIHSYSPTLVHELIKYNLPNLVELAIPTLFKNNQINKSRCDSYRSLSVIELITNRAVNDEEGSKSAWWDILALLIKEGAEIGLPYFRLGITCTEVFVEHNRVDLIELAISSYEKIPLIFAVITAKKNDKWWKVVELLLDKGADAMDSTPLGNAIKILIEENKYDLVMKAVKVLKENDAIDTPCESEGDFTLLAYIICRLQRDGKKIEAGHMYETIKLFIESGADVTVPNCCACCKSIIEYLIDTDKLELIEKALPSLNQDNRLSKKCCDGNTKTPLAYAKSQGKTEIISLLTEATKEGQLSKYTFLRYLFSLLHKKV